MLVSLRWYEELRGTERTQQVLGWETNIRNLAKISIEWMVLEGMVFSTRVCIIYDNSILLYIYIYIYLFIYLFD